MSLTSEWRERVEHWRDELAGHVYLPLGSVGWEGFTVREHLSAEQARRGAFEPMPAGSRWGGKWEYGWFRTQIVVPEDARDRPVVLKEGVSGGAECVVYVNGRLTGQWNSCYKLSDGGVPGEEHEVLVEAYAGHGPIAVSAGPTPPGRRPYGETPPQQREVGESSFGVWEEDVYQLLMDVRTLYDLREHLDPDSLRVAQIDAGLRDFSLTVDFEQSRTQMLETVRAARERLEPLLDCMNGSTVPTLFAFGHAHIDVAWLWPLAQTKRKCARTFANQLSLMERYPEYRFLQSQPQLLEYTRQHYPGLYSRVKEAARDGQFVADGGMWVEADTNVSGGEALIRQFLYGKRFFREEFDVDCELLWLPDVFGYSGALPQIMRGCGVKYFSTAKIFWAYHGGDPFPYNTFTWEGIDGSEVVVHLCNDYNSQTRPQDAIRRWKERVQKDGISSRLMPFGWGDGGGGPTRDHLEYLRRMENLEGVPGIRIASPTEYFKDLEERGVPDARYVGELYYQCHRGTYTSQARTKRLNRRSELALREAEVWAAAAAALTDFQVPQDELDDAWRAVLLNQFHDILPGTSIRRVYDEAEAGFTRAIDAARAVTAGAASALTSGSEDLTVFNSLSWERDVLVELPEGQTGAGDAEGVPLRCQEVEGRTLAEVKVPPCGWTTIRADAAEPGTESEEQEPHTLENECLRVEFGDRGEVVSIFDKETARDLTAGPCSAFRMFKDVPCSWDAWDIDSIYSLTPVELGAEAEFEMVSRGPLLQRARIYRRLNESEMVQDVTLRRGSRRVDFHTVIDWQERHKLLKVAFPVDIHTTEGIHEIQFGHIRRPNHSSRQFDADRFEVCSHKWTAIAEENRGFAVLNDCKYGVNVDGNSINLTLLKAPLAPDMTADRGRQEFTYAFHAWNGSFADSDVVQEAYDLNCPTWTAPGSAGTRSLFRLDASNLVLEAIKPAQDGSGDLVLRIYECKRMATRAVLSTPLPLAGAALADMLERRQAELEVGDGRIPLEFRPFEIKTVRLSLE
ncbi:MAG: glycoside hydrolase family 38 C-terminal domain-containing protein [Candidatus Brocadiaceae bacterium]